MKKKKLSQFASIEEKKKRERGKMYRKNESKGKREGEE